MAKKSEKKDQEIAKTEYDTLSKKLKGYKEFLKEIKVRIKSSQIKAAIAVNKELIQLYWGDWSLHPSKARERRMGYTGHWPTGKRSAKFLPWDSRIFSNQSIQNEGFLSSL